MQRCKSHDFMNIMTTKMETHPPNYFSGCVIVPVRKDEAVRPIFFSTAECQKNPNTPNPGHRMMSQGKRLESGISVPFGNAFAIELPPQACKFIKHKIWHVGYASPICAIAASHCKHAKRAPIRRILSESPQECRIGAE